MKMISWLLLLCCSILVVLALALTFIQPEFKNIVSVKLLFIPDLKIPMYLFILGTFTAGLGFGIATALVVFVKAKITGMKKNKRIRELESALAEFKNTLISPAPDEDVAQSPVQKPGNSPESATRI
jgi:hypothetical protein